MWRSGRLLAMRAGTISRIPPSTSPSGVPRRRSNSRPSWPLPKPRPMKSKSHPHWPSPPLSALREWQVSRLRSYLRETVLPFSAHYRGLFQKQGLDPDAFRSIDDLRRIPFTSKLDFESSVPGADPVKDFVLIPDQAVLKRRPSTLVRALFRGKKHVQEGFEHEFRPLMLTSTTGRSADPVPFLFTGHDVDNLKLA